MEIKIAYIGGGSRGWAWGLMSDLAGAEDLSGSVYLYDIDFEAAKAKAEEEAAFRASLVQQTALLAEIRDSLKK